MEIYKEYEFQVKENEKLTKEQVKIKEALQSFEHKKNENEMVKAELEQLDETDVVYKLIGPILIQQETADSKMQVDQRLELIKKEIAKMEKTLKNNDIKIESGRKRIQDLQEKFVAFSKQLQQMQAQQQQAK